jgi:hypothetical protein
VREGFAEAPVLLEGLQKYAHHQIIQLADLFEGQWEFLRQPLQPPTTSQQFAKDGNEAIAQAVVDFFQGQSD